MTPHYRLSSFYFTSSSSTVIYSLSLHDALPIYLNLILFGHLYFKRHHFQGDSFPLFYAHIKEGKNRSEEHTSELQSPYDLVCRLLPEKKKTQRLRVLPQAALRP